MDPFSLVTELAIGTLTESVPLLFGGGVSEAAAASTTAAEVSPELTLPSNISAGPDPSAPAPVETTPSSMDTTPDPVQNTGQAQPATITTNAGSSNAQNPSSGSSTVAQPLTFNDLAFANTMSPNLQADLTHKLTRLAYFTYQSSGMFTDILVLDLPSALYVNSSYAPPSATALFLRNVRTKFVFEIQVNAPMGAAGIMVVYFLPRTVSDSGYDHSTVFNSPHVIVDVARTSTARLVVPYAATTPYVPLSSNQMGSLRIMVLTPYRPPPNTSSTLTGVVYCAALESELALPMPRRQAPPPGVTWFSAHSQLQEMQIVNTPGSINMGNSRTANNAPTLSIAGEGFKIDSMTPGGARPFSDFAWVAMRPGTREKDFQLTWTPSQVAGTQLMAYNLDLGQSTAPLGIMANSFAYARGSLVVTLLCATSVFHKGRLRVCFEMDGTDEYNDQTSMGVFYTVMDFSSTNTGSLVVPYVSNTWYKPTSGSYWGRLKIFVNNPLSRNAAAFESVTVQVFLSFGADVKFYVPRSNNMLYQAPPTSFSQVQVTDPFAPNVTAIDFSRGLLGPDGSGEPHPMFTESHSRVENLLGRFWHVSDQVPASGTPTHFPVPFPANTHAALARTAAFFNGEPVFCVVNTTSHTLEVAHYWDDSILTGVTHAAASHGAILIPPNGHSVFSVPFYSQTPVRSTDSDSSLGILVLRALGSSTTEHVTLYAAIRSPNLFFPRPIPDWVLPTDLVNGSPSYRTALARLTLMRSSDPTLAPAVTSQIIAAASAQGWQRDLTQDGDVESNPGPFSLLIQLLEVYKPFVVGLVGGSILLGIVISDSVWQRDLPREGVEENPGPVSYSFIFFKMLKSPLLTGLFPPLLCAQALIALQRWLAVRSYDPLAPSQWCRDLTCEGIEPNPGPVRVIKNPLTEEYYLESQGVILKLVFSARKGKSKCSGTPCCKATRYKFEVVKPAPYLLAGPVIWDWTIVEYFSSCCKHDLCVHALIDATSPEVNFFLDNWALPVSKLSRTSVFAIVGWMFKEAPNFFRSPVFCQPTAPQAEYPDQKYWPDTSGALPQGPFSVFSLFDSYVLKSTLKAYAPFLIQSVINLYVMSVANNPVVTLLLGGVTMYNAVTLKPPPLLVTLIEAFSCGTYDAVCAAAAPLLEGAPLRLFNTMKNKIKGIFARPQNFASITTAAKHFVWWIKTVITFFQWIWVNLVNPPAQNEQIQMTVSDLVYQANSLLIRYNTEPDHRHELDRLKERLLGKLHVASKIPGLPERAQKLVCASIEKLCRTSPTVPEPVDKRPEPLGVWISGPPGVGKSLLMSKLAEDVMAIKKWKVYYHPVASEHYDGYTGQYVHCFDDLGQSKNELDLACICQAISCVPFIPPRAALEDKGGYYAGKLVIATTNRIDFDTYTLTDPGALKRRFPIKLSIGPPKFPFSKQTIADGSSFNISNFDTGAPVRYETLLHTILEDLDRRQAFAQNPEEEVPCSPDAHDDLWITRLEAFKVHEPLLPMLSDDEITPEVVRIRESIFRECPQRRAPEWAVMLFGAGGLAGLLLYAIPKLSSLVSGLLPKSETLPEDQGPYNPTGSATRISARELARRASPQSPFSAPFTHLFKNCAYLTCGDRWAHALVSGRNLIINKHMSKDFSGIVKIATAYGEYSGRLLHIRDEGDVSVFLLPPGTPIYKELKFRIPSLPFNPPAFLLYMTSDSTFAQQVKDLKHIPISNYWHGAQKDSFSYSTHTRSGMCGGLLITQIDGNWVPLGIHMAGLPTTGFAASPIHALPPLPQGIITQVREGQLRIHRPSHTKLRPSPVAAIVESELAPAVLSAHDRRLDIQRVSNEEFLMEKCKKYCSDQVCNHPDLLQAVVDELEMAITRHTELVCEPVTLEEAAFDTVTPLDHTSSPGYKYAGTKRRDLIDFENKIISPRLRNDVANLELQFRGTSTGAGEVKFASFLKDELRPLSKIASGDTRVVEACSLDYTLLMRMYLLRFFQMCYQSDPTLFGMAPGMNVYTDMLPLCTSLFDYNYCFDYSKFDSRLPLQVMHRVAQMISNLTPEPQFVMRLFQPILISTHIVGSNEIVVEGGMPSGCPITTIMNTLCNVVMTHYCMLLLDPNSDFWPVAYGDDLILSTRKPIDTELYCKIMNEEFGMILTGADKTTTVQAVPPMSVDFLKRRMHYTPEFPLPVPVLPLDSLLSRICWCRGETEFKQQLESFSYEVALYGQSVYERIRVQLMPTVTMMSWPVAHRTVLTMLGCY
ncbi:polyprotein [kunsagivirus C1]|uniref:Genome polyprotein n=1 Tax=kunsagivirus C1 TaxID=2870349 RepID=A0A1S6ZGH7_9PICO|nr:polyprotein [kunsagivirus C1]AQX56710.1 polyprotein [kunsagivirus C1]